MPFIDHPLRERVVSEMHMRRMPPLSPGMEMIQVVRLVDAAERTAEREHVLAMPSAPGEPSDVRMNHVGGRCADGTELLWERHSEASTMTIISAAPSAGVAAAAVEPRALSWLREAPGQVLRAVRIVILADGAPAEAALAAADFRRSDLVSATIGQVTIWSDFLIRPDDFGRLLVVAGEIPPTDLGRCVQQVQELGNYRNLALLGLPLAQAQGPALAALETQLVGIARRMAEGEAQPALLDQLCGLAAQATVITATTAFRMSATAAYAQIVEDRLAALQAQRVVGYQSLEEFTERRLLPATRTCASFSARLEALSVRIERATSLLRTQVELALQAQNAELLRSMDRSAARQLRLQRVVEGLSVVAVSYYAVGLLGYPLHVLAERTGTDPELLIAASVLPVVALVWAYLRHRVGKLVGHAD